MKKIQITFIIILSFSFTTYAQEWDETGDNYTSGHLGIGVSSLSELNGLITLKGTGDSQIILGTDNSHAHHLLSYRDFVFNSFNGFFFRDSETAGDYSNYTDLMTLTKTGYLGLGTTSPEVKLHVNGTVSCTWTPTIGTVGIFESSALDRAFITIIGKSSAQSEVWFGDELKQNAGRIRYEHDIDALEFWTNDGNRMTILNNGQVGIGTENMGTHKLAVEGTIGAREIKVEASGWSDFVFDKDYDLKSLEEVEQYITTNNHLPEIPDASEVEENGINLGEMNAKLLQKIEELTLYTIQQDKEINALKKENEVLKTLSERLSAIERQLESEK